MSCKTQPEHSPMKSRHNGLIKFTVGFCPRGHSSVVEHSPADRISYVFFFFFSLFFLTFAKTHGEQKYYSFQNSDRLNYKPSKRQLNNKLHKNHKIGKTMDFFSRDWLQSRGQFIKTLILTIYKCALVFFV